MSGVPSVDRSNGYETAAVEFMGRRGGSRVGVAQVLEWARRLPAGGSVLDLGCGNGLPISEALIDAGLDVHGVDAAPTMIAAFRARFPEAPAECAAVEESEYFARTFDGVVAWGLMFLLPEEVQIRLVGRIAGVLEPGGSFLFTAPWQPCEWEDVLTGRTSRSIGREGYARAIAEAGLELVAEMEDEGDNHYYVAVRPR